MFSIEDYNKVMEYLESNPNLFKEYEINYIKWFLKQDKVDRDIPCFVLELFDKLGILPRKYNVYEDFFKLLKDNFDIKDKRILEIGGGIIPSLSKRIEGSLNKGSITVYDPRLDSSIENSSKLILVRDKFDFDKSTDDIDLIVSLKPYEYTEELIKYILEHKVDFMIGLCEDGLHGDSYDYFDTTADWIHSILYQVYRGLEKNNMGELNGKRLESSPYPVIYNKRK